jgi:hypothetical protein
VARLVRLLGSRRSEEACAAAIVLGALGPREGSVARALARRLRPGDPIRFYVLEALARQRTGEALDCVTRALVSHGVDRDHARRLIRGFGSRALPGIARALDANPGESQILFSAAAELRTPASVAWLVRRLAAATPTEARAIYLAIRRDMNAWPRALRGRLRARALRLIAPGAAESRSAALAALRLLRVLHDIAIVEPVRDLARSTGDLGLREEAASLLRSASRVRRAL